MRRWWWLSKSKSSKPNSTRTPAAQIHDPFDLFLGLLRLVIKIITIKNLPGSWRWRDGLVGLIERWPQIVLCMLMHGPYNKIPPADSHLIFQCLNSPNTRCHKPSLSCCCTHVSIFFIFYFLILQLRIYRDMGFWICVYWKKWGGSEFFYGDLNNSMLSDWRSRRLFIVWEIKELKASKTSGAGGFFILLKNSTGGQGTEPMVFSKWNHLICLFLFLLIYLICWKSWGFLLPCVGKQWSMCYFFSFTRQRICEQGRNSLKRKIKSLGRIGLAQ